MPESATGREFFTKGYLCAESVVLAVCRSRGIESNLIPRAATGFCSGLSRLGSLCGALTGGVLSLGVLHGRDRPEDALDPVYGRVQELAGLFEEKYGALACRDLTGCDFNTPEGQASFKERELGKNLCWGITDDVVAWVLEMS